MPTTLSPTEIQQQLAQLPAWILKNNRIERTFSFANFLGSIAFVNQLVEPAETAGHHPDLCISWNKVTVSLTTHDAGGLTQLDFDLAKTITNLAAQ